MIVLRMAKPQKGNLFHLLVIDIHDKDVLRSKQLQVVAKAEHWIT